MTNMTWRRLYLVQGTSDLVPGDLIELVTVPRSHIGRKGAGKDSNVSLDSDGRSMMKRNAPKLHEISRFHWDWLELIAMKRTVKEDKRVRYSILISFQEISEQTSSQAAIWSWIASLEVKSISEATPDEKAWLSWLLVTCSQELCVLLATQSFRFS